jgi:glucose 1-dehydrogenase
MPDRLLEGQRAIVTGASSGIGEAIAHAFAASGASVLVNYLSDVNEAERVVREIAEGGGKAAPVQGDVSKPEGCEQLFNVAQQ